MNSFKYSLHFGLLEVLTTTKCRDYLNEKCQGGHVDELCKIFTSLTVEENDEICVKASPTVGRDFLGMARTDVIAVYIISGHL